MVESEEALRIGLVDKVIEPDALLSEAQALAREVSQHSPTAIALVKRLIDGALETPLEDEFDLEADAQTQAIQGAHHREAVAAFLEGRRARFGEA
jgi:enoyl-CoA hydratase/carnithine racemase